MNNSSMSNGVDQEVIKVLPSFGLTMLQHMLLLIETKGSCAHMLL